MTEPKNGQTDVADTKKGSFRKACGNVVVFLLKLFGILVVNSLIISSFSQATSSASQDDMVGGWIISNIILTLIMAFTFLGWTVLTVNRHFGKKAGMGCGVVLALLMVFGTLAALGELSGITGKFSGGTAAIPYILLRIFVLVVFLAVVFCGEKDGENPTGTKPS